MVDVIAKVVGHVISAAIVFVVIAALVRLFCWSFYIGWNWRYPVGVFSVYMFAVLIMRQGTRQ